MRMRRTAGYDFATHGLPTCVTIQPRFERMLVDIPKELDIVRNTRVPLQNNHVPKIVLKHACNAVSYCKVISPWHFLVRPMGGAGKCIHAQHIIYSGQEFVFSCVCGYTRQ